MSTFPSNFQFAEVPTLIIGAGGGADSLSVMATMQSKLFGLHVDQCFPAITKSRRIRLDGLLKGTFKTNPERTRFASPKLGDHLIQMSTNRLELPKLDNGEINWKLVNQRWSSPIMEEALPRVGAAPYLVLHSLTDKASLESAKLSLQKFCQEHQIQQIIAIDNGGDILKPFKDIEEAGRDQKTLHVLEQLGLAIWVMIIAPGSDGDFTQVELAKMRNAFLVNYRDIGVFSLNVFRTSFTEFGPWMGKKRTVNIINNSWQTSPKGEGMCTVKRGEGKQARSQQIPHSWIQSGWLFQRKV